MVLLIMYCLPVDAWCLTFKSDLYVYLSSCLMFNITEPKTTSKSSPDNNLKEDLRSHNWLLSRLLLSVEALTYLFVGFELDPINNNETNKNKKCFFYIWHKFYMTFLICHLEAQNEIFSRSELNKIVETIVYRIFW